MSLHTLTVDQLMQLDKKTLEYALRIFQQELAGTLALLRDTPQASCDEQVLDDLHHVLTLRKVFALRLAELEEEADARPVLRLAAAQYEFNELHPDLVS